MLTENRQQVSSHKKFLEIQEYYILLAMAMTMAMAMRSGTGI